MKASQFGRWVGRHIAMDIPLSWVVNEDHVFEDKVISDDKFETTIRMADGQKFKVTVEKVS